MRLAVIDASVVVDLLIDSSEQAVAIAGTYESLNAPAHLDAECLNALRGVFLAGRLTSSDFAGVASLVAQMPVTRHPLTALVPRIVELAANATAYDAAYIALAEALEADLLTTDERLARVPGITCTVRVL